MSDKTGTVSQQMARKIYTFQLLSRQQTRHRSAPFILFLSASYATFVALVVLASLQSSNAHSLSDNSIHEASHQSQHQAGSSSRVNHRISPASLSQIAAPQQQAQQQGQMGSLNRCQSGWIWFNNKCWVTIQSRRDFQHAIELCKKMYNSTLPTIHSEDENEFLKQNIDLTNSPIWLFAKHNHQYNKTRWLDKSPVNYTRWDAGQPSDKSSLVCIKTEESWYMRKAEPVDGQTECVSFWNDAKWGTQVGCQVLLPVVCERKLTPISRLTDGPDSKWGTMSSSFEQQVAPISGASGSTIGPQTTAFALLFTAIASNLFGIMPTITNR